MKNIYISAIGGFLSGSDTAEPDWIHDTLRSFFSFLDNAAYGLLGIMYELFFNVASAELFTNATIKNFYSRVQLIIGVFMVFKLAITIMQGIVNPDKFTDKNNGFGSLITRVVFALVMLTLLVPINIPSAKTEYEIQLNNNGLLFGTLYSLQNRLLSNNTLGRLILGTTDESTTTTSSNDDTLSGADKQAESIKKSANVFTSTIFKGFFRINLLPGKDDETKNDNRMCSDIDDDILDVYKQLDASPSELLAFVNEDCKSSGDKRYVFCYLYIISTVVAVIFAFILGGFIVDIAIRAVKLAVLRLIAPIPIISYIEPKQAKEGAFAAWVKALTSTYLDLFLRLAIVYFVIFLIQDMIVNGIVINTGTGIIGAISVIFIWIGLFFFARQAPKFIKDVLGLKGPGMSNIGLSAMLGGTATLTSGGGIQGALASAMNSSEAAIQAQNQGKALSLGQTWSSGQDLAAQITTGDPKAKGGMFNNINDRLMRGAGVNAAWRRYGVSQNGLDIEKNRVQNLEAQAAEAQDYYNRLTQGNLTTQEMDNLAMSGLITTDHTGNQVISEMARQRAYDKMSKLQADAGKARKSYDEIKKFADSHRISPSTEEKYRRSLRESLPFANSQANRADFYDNSNRFVARHTEHHDSLEDRILGGANGEGLRWRPGSDASGANVYHDRPEANLDTPGIGQGPHGGPPPGP